MSPDTGPDHTVSRQPQSQPQPEQKPPSAAAAFPTQAAFMGFVQEILSGAHGAEWQSFLYSTVALVKAYTQPSASPQRNLP